MVDVVPGCDARSACSSEDEVLANVARHADEVHSLAKVPAELVASIRSAVISLAA